MYVERVLTILSEAAKLAFDAEHPDSDMRNLPVRLEYPLEQAHYPGLWINYTQNGDMHNVGIGHVEYVDGPGPGDAREVYRWTFSGVAEITVAALSNLERARMVDALARTIAFGRLDDTRAISDFRKKIENNDLVGLRVVWESFGVGGWAATPGTPWGTDDVIYEATISMSMDGEIIYDPQRGVLIPLTSIVVYHRLDSEPDTVDPSDPAWL